MNEWGTMVAFRRELRRAALRAAGVAFLGGLAGWGIILSRGCL